MNIMQMMKQAQGLQKRLKDTQVNLLILKSLEKKAALKLFATVKANSNLFLFHRKR